MLYQLSYAHRQRGRRVAPEPASLIQFSGAAHTSISASCSTVGAPGGSRTPDPRLRRPLLYPTELRAHAYDSNWLASRPFSPSSKKVASRLDTAALALALAGQARETNRSRAAGSMATTSARRPGPHHGVGRGHRPRHHHDATRCRSLAARDPRCPADRVWRRGPTPRSSCRRPRAAWSLRERRCPGRLSPASGRHSRRHRPR